jgi:hypothetical protein
MTSRRLSIRRSFRLSSVIEQPDGPTAWATMTRVMADWYQPVGA